MHCEIFYPVVISDICTSSHKTLFMQQETCGNIISSFETCIIFTTPFIKRLVDWVVTFVTVYAMLPLYKYGYLEAFDSKTDKM